MKITFEKKIVIGFIATLLIVCSRILIYFLRTRNNIEADFNKLLDWVEYGLEAVFVGLLVVFFIIIRREIKEKNVSEYKMLEKEQLLESILNNTSNPISIKKIDGEYLMINKKYESIFQISNEKVIGKMAEDIFPKDFAAVIKNTDYDVLKVNKEIKVEETIPEPDGLHTYLAVKFPLHDQGGRIYAIGSILTDISERKIYEDSLKAGDKFFKISSDILVIASETHILKMNPVLSSITGYTEKELKSKPFLSFVHPEDVKPSEEQIVELKNGIPVYNFENRWVCKDGSIKWLNWSASPDLQNGLTIYSVGRDVTELKENVETLKAADKFFNLSLDMMTIASYTHFLKINPSFTRILGYSEEELLSRPFKSFVHPDDHNKTASEVVNLSSGLKTINFENRYICKDGSIKWLNWQSFPDTENNLLYASARDITEQRKMENELKDYDGKIKLILSSAEVGGWDWDLQNDTSWRTPLYDQIFGFDHTKLKWGYADFIERVIPEDIDYVKEHFDSFASSGVLDFECRIRRLNDNSVRWIAAKGKLQENSNRENKHALGIISDITYRKNLEESIRISDEFFNLSDEIFTIAKDDHFLKVNPNYTKIMGYEDEEIRKIKFMSLVHPNDVASVNNELQKMNLGGNMVRFRVRCLTKKGIYKWIEWSASIDQKTNRIYSVGRDIEDLIDKEKSLLIADKFFNMAFEMLIVGNETHFIKINPAFTRILGYEQEDMDDINYIDLTYPEDLNIVKAEIDKLLTGTPIVSYKCRIKPKMGDYKWIHFSATSDLKSGLIYVVARDITDEIQIEKLKLEALNLAYENEEKLKLILENIGDGVIVANSDRRVMMANYSANKLFNVTDDANISFNLSDHFKLYYPDEKTIFPSQYLPVEKALLGETTEDVDVVLWNPETQTKKRVLISGRPLVDPENKIVAAVVTFKDISRYKQMEEELRESELKYRRVIGFKKDEDENEGPGE